MVPHLAQPGPTRRPTRAPWRVTALAAASTVTLAACGGGASVPGSAPTTPTTAVSPAPAATTDVGIVNFKFTPATLTVKVGTTVVWTNKDAIAHTVNFATSGINSSVLNQNDHFSHAFTVPGTYDYICSIHPFMHGSVIVTS